MSEIRPLNCLMIFKTPGAEEFSREVCWRGKQELEAKGPWMSDRPMGSVPLIQVTVLMVHQTPSARSVYFFSPPLTFALSQIPSLNQTFSNRIFFPLVVV